MSTYYYAIGEIDFEALKSTPGCILHTESDGKPYSADHVVLEMNGNFVHFDAQSGAQRYGNNEPDDILRAVSKQCGITWIDEYTLSELSSADFNHSDCGCSTNDDNCGNSDCKGSDQESECDFHQ